MRIRRPSSHDQSNIWLWICRGGGGGEEGAKLFIRGSKQLSSPPIQADNISTFCIMACITHTQLQHTNCCFIIDHRATIGNSIKIINWVMCAHSATRENKISYLRHMEYDNKSILLALLGGDLKRLLTYHSWRLIMLTQTG